ncbi:MAG: PaaI family thioesterase [Thermoplasmata archaeon]|nr:PaaI family thioesterase [Thermoplasmata archaeon]MCI4338149.1 PaaI family thioesterase [Thermoplasmata archaeon]MCI4340794.1 PaaI family thioesterase [Thermoplasmata archaeon]
MATRPSMPEPRPIRPPKDWTDRKSLGGFHSEVGFSVDLAHSGPGFCAVDGVVEPRHLNINGVVHGGVYATILDTAMGGAVVSLLREGEVTATTSLYIEFLRPAGSGERLSARGEVVRRGRHLAFAEGKLEDGEGRRLSQAHGTWYIWAASDGTWTTRRRRAGDAAPAAAPTRPPRK